MSYTITWQESLKFVTYCNDGTIANSKKPQVLRLRCASLRMTDLWNMLKTLDHEINTAIALAGSAYWIGVVQLVPPAVSFLMVLFSSEQ
jgi:hypothetical protein